jgi:hypothetical protein
MQTKREWDHKLEIKSIFQDTEGTPLTDTTKGYAVEVIRRINILIAGLPDASQLSTDLIEVVQCFEEVAEQKTPASAQAVFNDSLDRLFDVGDSGKRIWVY